MKIPSWRRNFNLMSFGACSVPIYGQINLTEDSHCILNLLDSSELQMLHTFNNTTKLILIDNDDNFNLLYCMLVCKLFA